MSHVRHSESNWVEQRRKTSEKCEIKILSETRCLWPHRPYTSSISVAMSSSIDSTAMMSGKTDSLCEFRVSVHFVQFIPTKTNSQICKISNEIQGFVLLKEVECCSCYLVSNDKTLNSLLVRMYCELSLSSVTKS